MRGGEVGVDEAEKTNPNFQDVNKPYRVSPHQMSQKLVYNLVMESERGVGLKERRDLR